MNNPQYFYVPWSDQKFSLLIRVAGTKPSTEPAKERVHTSRFAKGDPSVFLGLGREFS
jgi:hypothetical protein